MPHLEKPKVLFDLTTDSRSATQLRDSLEQSCKIGPSAKKLLFRNEVEYPANVRLRVVGFRGAEVARSELQFPQSVLKLSWERGFNYAPPIVGVLLREKYLQSELGAFRVIPIHAPIRPSHIGDPMLFNLYEERGEDGGAQVLGTCPVSDIVPTPDDLFLFTLLGK